MQKKSQTGFTLIEILIVVLIIGIFVLIGILYAVRQIPKARDARRQEDINFTHNYLEQYYTDNRKYPNSEEDASDFAGLRTLFAGEYLTRFVDIKDPSDYEYIYSVVGEGYCVCAQLKRNEGNSGEACDFGAAEKTYYCKENKM